MHEPYTPPDHQVVVDAITQNLCEQLHTLVKLLPSLGPLLLTKLQEAQSVEQLVGVEHALIMLPGGVEVAEALEAVFDLLIGSFQIVGPRKWQQSVSAFAAKTPPTPLQ